MLSPDRKTEIGQNPSLKSVTESISRFVSPSIPDINTLRRIISHPAARTLTNLTLAGMVAISTISFGVNNPAQAEGNLSKAPITLQGVDNPYYFTYKGNIRRWPFDNARWGISPNNTERGVGTIDDYFNEDTRPTNYIQPQESKYPETQLGYGISLAIAAVGADPEAGCGGMLTATSRAEGNIWDSYYEAIRSLDNPIDYSDGARSVTSVGLLQHGIKGNSDLELIIGKDASGGFVRIYFGPTNTYDPSEAGWRKAKRDDSSCVVSGSFIKEDSKPYKFYLPSFVTNRS